MRSYLVAAIPLVAFLGIASAVGNVLYRESADGYTPSTLPSSLIGQPHPHVDLPPLAGSSTPGLADAGIRERVTVVNIFASWCIPCRQEHPVLMELAKDTRITVVAINYKDAPEKALPFLRENGNPFAAIGIDARGRASIDWGVYGVPETFVINRDGRIVAKHVGPLDAAALAKDIRPFLDQALAGG